MTHHHHDFMHGLLYGLGIAVIIYATAILVYAVRHG